MKKILALCAFALTVGYAQAQTTAGRMMIGGGIGYTTRTNETSFGDAKSNQLNINPQFGYFIVDNLAIGLTADYYKTKYTRPEPLALGGEADITFNTTIISPFARYYVFTPNEKFAFYAEASAGIGFSTQDNNYYNSADPTDEDIKSKSFNARILPGFCYFFNEKWALDLQLNGISYSSNDPNTDSDVEDDKTSSFTVGTSSLNPSLGFRYFIGK
jgi:outer membrane protein W